MTDANGNYSFVDLAPGTYTVSEVLQTGWKQTAPTPIPPGNYSITLGEAQDVTGKDFGNFQLGKISGMKFNDLNGNGVNDSEPALSGWTISLKNPDGTISTTTTATDGTYSFTGLTAGTYTISEVLLTGWVQTFPAPPGTYSVPVTSGTDSKNNDFGNFQLGKISGMKFNDLNGNGIKEAGEPALSGWTINLTNPDGTVSTNTTAADGTYSFTGLTAGTYTVGEVLQTGWVQTFPAAPGTYSMTVTSGTDSKNNDFGNFQLGKISGMKFNDLNGNGVNDSEPALSGWTINLTNPDGTVSTTTTAADGTYSFLDLTAGTYTISEVLQTGWVQTFPAAPGTYSVTVTSGTDSKNNDFGNFQLGKISGMKFNDLNGNGIKEAGEPALSGWTINLTNPDGTVSTNTTAADGTYSFTGLTAGTYTVGEVLQTGWVQTFPAAPGTYSMTVTSGTDSKNNDFGNFQLGKISGMKFNDLNGNGVNDSEPALSGWTINLTNPDGTVSTTTTAADGTYSFLDLTAGTYTISEVLQTGWVQTFPAAPGTYSVTVTSGTDSKNNDFGNFQTRQLSFIKFGMLDMPAGGNTISYRINATNSGFAKLDIISVTDPNDGQLSCIPSLPTTLDPSPSSTDTISCGPISYPANTNPINAPTNITFRINGTTTDIVLSI